MPDKTISQATPKHTLAATDMLPLAAVDDDTAYKITGEDLFSSIPAATTAARGTVELATVTEAKAGTDTERAVTPAGLLIRETDTDAIIAGDLSGDPRGVGSLDVQSDHASTQVASGEGAVAVGIDEKAAAAGAVAVGVGNDATGTNSVSMGNGNDATQPSAVALGLTCDATADSAVAVGVSCVANDASAVALGKGAVARVQKTVNICGPIIQRKDNGELAGAEFESFCGVEVVLMTKEVDLEVIADQTLYLPADCHFYPTQVGLIITSASAVSGQPRIQFGWEGMPSGILGSTQPGLTAKYQRVFWNVSSSTEARHGKANLIAGVTYRATATTLRGRFYFQGLLVEDE